MVTCLLFLSLQTMVTASTVLYKTPAEDVASLIRIVTESLVDRFYVIDHSPTECLSKIIPQDDRIVYIARPNKGYGAGNNFAIRRAQEDGSIYHLVLNPDVSWTGDVMTPLLKFMESNEDVGMVMPRILYPSGKLQCQTKLLPTPFDMFLRRFLPRNFFTRRRELFEMSRSSYDKIMNVPYLSGCFMLLRMSVLEEIGLFDERFFMYPEDIDLTRRIHERYKTIFYPDVSVVHKLNQESRRNPRLFVIHVVNLIRYFNKWGWFDDPQRKIFNREAIEAYRL